MRGARMSGERRDSVVNRQIDRIWRFDRLGLVTVLRRRFPDSALLKNAGKNLGVVGGPDRIACKCRFERGAKPIRLRDIGQNFVFQHDPSPLSTGIPLPAMN